MMITKDLLTKVLKSIETVKAVNTKVLSCHRLGYRYVLITEGMTVAHISTITAGIYWLLRKNYDTVSFSSWDQKNWRIINCEDIMVHVMSRSLRCYYNLEALYKEEK